MIYGHPNPYRGPTDDINAALKGKLNITVSYLTLYCKLLDRESWLSQNTVFDERCNQKVLWLVPTFVQTGKEKLESKLLYLARESA